MKKERFPPKSLPIKTSMLLFVVFVSLVFFSCKKDVVVNNSATTVAIRISNFHVSETKLVLLQANGSNRAFSVDWTTDGDESVSYTIEAAVTGSSFADPVELGSTKQSNMIFTVQDFNTSISRILYANNTGSVDLRVRAENASSKKSIVYSQSLALQVTTYQNYVDYDESSMFKIPGNYQGWNLATAPKIVSAGNAGEYEGYINFTNPYSQMLMVKGNQWDPKITYSYIGDNKFGFGGSVMSVFGGAGIYLFKANANSNSWSYTKINNWVIAGTAVTAGETVMKENTASLSWNITVNLVKGSFRFTANHDAGISFGQRSTDAAGTPSYDGDNILIKQDGNYTLKLELQSAGNYAYSILKNQ